jgi:hypothetical protein
LRSAVPLERGLIVGAILFVLGLVAFGIAVAKWADVGFGQLTSGNAIRLVILSSATLVLGAQILYGSFFLYLLDYRGSGHDKR